MIAVVAYDRRWPVLFEHERRVLEEVLAPWLEGGVEHVGSTAVRGLAAKPFLDVVAGVRELAAARAAFAPLHALGYVHAPHRPGIAHHFERPPSAPGEPGVGLHLTEPGSDLWRERLAFRDALRADTALAAEYEALKRRLALEHATDLPAYTAGKRAFVVAVLGAAGIALGRR